MTDTALTDPTPDVQGPTIERRRPLPNRRAVLGALLVTIATVGAFVVAASGSDRPDTTYLVTTRSIDAGDRIDADDLREVPIRLPGELTATALSALPGPVTALIDLGVGQLLRRDQVTEALLSSDLVEPVHELTIPVPRDRVGDSLVAGDRVTVLSTTKIDGDDTTMVAAEDAVVLAWGVGGDRIATSTSGTLTLALPDPDRVLAVAHLAQTGEISVVRTTRALSHRYPPSFTLPAGGGRAADPLDPAR